MSAPMTRRELISLVQGIPSEMISDGWKAAACIAISVMPKQAFQSFAVKASEGIERLRARDFDGLREMLKAEGADGEVMETAEMLFRAIADRPDLLDASGT